MAFTFACHGVSQADFARIVVTRSSDRGLTWLNETVVASPVPGTPYECALVDGAGFWDGDIGAWFYLSQVRKGVIA